MQIVSSVVCRVHTAPPKNMFRMWVHGMKSPLSKVQYQKKPIDDGLRLRAKKSNLIPEKSSQLTVGGNKNLNLFLVCDVNAAPGTRHTALFYIHEHRCEATI